MIVKTGKSIFLYVNQPVVRYNRCYYVKFKNFVDFMAYLTNLNDAYRLVVPCKVLSYHPGKDFIPINLPDKVIEVIYYAGEQQAILANFLSAFHIAWYVQKELKSGKKVIMGGPGPNSFLFWSSWIVPKSVRFVFFIRGNTLETIRRCYEKKLFYPIVSNIIELFRWRICSLTKKKRAKVFTFGEKIQKIYQVGNGNIHAITPLIDKSFVREDLRPNIPQERMLKVLYVGRLSSEKNVSGLIDACILSFKRGQAFALTIVGSGPNEAKIQNRIIESGCSSQIRFLGHVAHGDDLKSQFDIHDLLCLPSYTEGTPRAVIEAFARGMPVVATSVGSLPNFFFDEIKFLDGFSAKDILDGIVWCDAHRSELSAMGRKGRLRIDSFLISENAKRVNKILQEFC